MVWREWAWLGRQSGWGVFSINWVRFFFFSRSFCCFFYGRCLVAWLNYESRRGSVRVGVAWEKKWVGCF